MTSPNNADTADFTPAARTGTPRPASASSRVRVDVDGRSHVGKVRSNNEDHFLVARVGRSLETLKTNVPAGQVPDRFDEVGYGMVVADGMGGAAAGEVASSLAIRVAVESALDSPKWALLTTPDEIREAADRWRARFRAIDAAVIARSRADAALAGMGTTLTVACSVADDLMLYHAGDSRAYLFRRGALHQLTHDHTVAQGLADAGWIGPDEVRRHVTRHTLTRVLGHGGGKIEAEIQHLRLADGDRLLLCTDGLTEMVPDDRIADVLRLHEPSADACRALVDVALACGGTDNVTVVVARFAIPEPAAP